MAIIVGACATPPPAAPTQKAPPSDTAPRDVLDYVPAAGIRWLCFAQPRRISRDSALERFVLRVLDRERLDAFKALTAVDLTELEAVAIAGYDLGTLYVAALGSSDGGAARAKFQERLSTGAIVKHSDPLLHRVSGTRAGVPRTLLSVNDRLLAVATGDPSLARVAEGYAAHRLKSPTALHGAALSTLPPLPSDALGVVEFAGPFTGEWASALHGVVGGALAVSLVLQAGSPSTLLVTTTLSGDWTGTDARTALEAAWDDLARSATGQLFGLGNAKNVRIVADLHWLTWSAELPLEELVAGLRAASVANVPEMFGDHGDL